SVEWFPDKETVLLEDGNYKRPIIEGTFEECQEVMSQYDENQPTIEDIVKWMEDHKDSYIVLRTKESDESIFLKVKADYPDIKDRFIVEMWDFEHHIKLSNK